jgi:hypothetical protein
MTLWAARLNVASKTNACLKTLSLKAPRNCPANNGGNRRDRNRFNEVVTRVTLRKTYLAASMLTRRFGLPPLFGRRFFAP